MEKVITVLVRLTNGAMFTKEPYEYPELDKYFKEGYKVKEMQLIHEEKNHHLIATFILSKD